MNKAFGHQLPLEMMFLWLIETTACFVALCLISSFSLNLTGSMRAEILNDAAVLALTIGLTSFASGLYQPGACLETRQLPVKIIVTAVLSVLMIWLTSHALRIDITNIFGRDVFWPVKILAVWTILVFVTRLIFSWAARMDMFVRQVVIIGSPEQAARTIKAVDSQGRGVFRVAATLPAVSQLSLDFLRREKVRDVIVNPAAGTDLRAEDVASYRALNIEVWGDPEFWERRLGRIHIDQPVDQASSPLAGRNVPGWFTAGVSRFLDIVLSVALLVFTLPLMLVTALLIKVETPGPVFYRQERVGLHGCCFTLCKFRSMRVDAESRGPTWAAKRDLRVTRVGSLIRRIRIDELPQLLNVLRGEMSFIGPRPERPYFVDQIAQTVPLYHERALVKPGLTGWAQVNFPYGASIEDARVKLSYDLYYVKHRSLFLDLLILLSTVRVILFQEGAR